MSTAEAEYITATHIAKQVLWHRSLYMELNFPLPTTSTIFTNNQAVIAISHHPEFHAHTKHIDINYHFLQDLISIGKINTVYVNTRDNLADLFTKVLRRQQGATNKVWSITPDPCVHLQTLTALLHLHSGTSGSLLLTKLLLSYVATN